MNANQEKVCAVEGCGGALDGRHGDLCTRHRYLQERYGSVDDDPRAERYCDCCGYGFTPSRRGQRFCSDECRREAWAERRRADAAGSQSAATARE